MIQRHGFITAGHSLWLQRRSGRLRVRRVWWRGDWTPIGLVVLLLALLILLSVIWPRNEVFERAKQAAEDDTTVGTEHPPVVGALAEP